MCPAEYFTCSLSEAPTDLAMLSERGRCSLESHLQRSARRADMLLPTLLIFVFLWWGVFFLPEVLGVEPRTSRTLSSRSAPELLPPLCFSLPFNRRAGGFGLLVLGAHPSQEEQGKRPRSVTGSETSGSAFIWGL